MSNTAAMAFVRTSPGSGASPDWFFVGPDGWCLASDGGEKLSKFMTFGHMLSQYEMDLDNYEPPPDGLLPPWV